MRDICAACVTSLLLLAAPALAAAPAQETSTAAAPQGAPVVAGAGQADGAVAEAQARYNELLARAQAGDPAVDLAAMREAFTRTPAYRATMMAAYQALWTPLGRGDFPAALAVADKV